MLVRLRIGKASALKNYLANEHGILIRDASNFEGLDEHFFRIAAQTVEENDRLVQAIEQWLSLIHILKSAGSHAAKFATEYVI